MKILCVYLSYIRGEGIKRIEKGKKQINALYQSKLNKSPCGILPLRFEIAGVSYAQIREEKRHLSISAIQSVTTLCDVFTYKIALICCIIKAH